MSECQACDPQFSVEFDLVDGQYSYIQAHGMPEQMIEVMRKKYPEGRFKTYLLKALGHKIF